jgi:uncharacterized protein YdbL (DUF1318 family)
MRKFLMAAGILAIGLGWVRVQVACAQEGISADVEKATNDRRARRPDLMTLEIKGVIGENKSGLVQVMLGHETDAAAAAMEDQENNDRMVIYNSVVAKNNLPMDEVQTMNAKNLQCDASTGTPIEVLNDQGSAYEWKVK